MTGPVSLTAQVTAITVSLGGATLDDLSARLPNVAREKLRQAVQNARKKGYLRLAQRGRGLGGRGGGSAPSVYCGTEAGYAPAPVAPARVSAVASVFDLAGGASVVIPKTRGTVYQPLGSWSD